MIARASQWSSGEVAGAVEGRLFGRADCALDGVSTDTRDALQNKLFVAIRGERFDAHGFLDRAVEAGAGALLVSDPLSDADCERWAARVPVVRVQDTVFGLGQLARAHRRRWPVKVIALTGSNGKTTTKEMLAALLSAHHTVLKTEGNLNNLIGLPLTLLGLAATHEVAVVEMGMNALGEIRRLTEIAAPDAGLVNNVGPAHIGMLGSLDNIQKAKGELFEGLAPSAWAVVNQDDARVEAASKTSPAEHRRTFGTSEGCDVRVLESTADGDGERARFSIDGREISALVPYPGRHNVMNAAAAIAAATLPFSRLADDLSGIEDALRQSAHVSGRLELIDVGPYHLVDDCYNANAASMIAAIETLTSRTDGRVVALLGEMRELGEFSEAEHVRVGQAAAARGVALLGAFGDKAWPLARSAEAAGVETMHEASDDRALFEWLRARLEPGDTILVKGSRGIRMERFIDLLKEAVS